jgi:hypothetical protein
MMDRTSLLLASFRRPPEDAHSPTVTAGWEAAGSGNANSPLRSHDGALDDVPARRPGKITMTRQSASDIVVRAALSQADRYRILALPYPVEYQVFWQLLAGLGMTQECLMDRMGGSP